MACWLRLALLSVAVPLAAQNQGSQTTTPPSVTINHYSLYITNINVQPQRNDNADFYRFMNDPRLHEPPGIVAYGTRDLDQVRASAGQKILVEPPPARQDDEVVVPTLQAVKDNLDVVVNGTLQDAVAYVEGSGRKDALHRLESLKLVSVVGASVREDPPGSGFYGAQAVFRDGDDPQLVEAKIIADFSDPHWHLTSIKLPKAPEAVAAATKPATEQKPPVDPGVGFRTAVYDYVRKVSLPDAGFIINDSERETQWSTMLRLIHSEDLKSLGGGSFQGRVEFVDLSQKHVFCLDFFVRARNGAWRVERTTLRSIDGNSRKA